MKLLRYLVLAAIALSLFVVNPFIEVDAWNDGSRLATAQALVEHGTFSIDETIFINTGDKVFINGRFYSDKPPLPSLMAAAVYAPLYQLGLNLSFGYNAAYYFITLFTMKLTLLAALYCFYLALGRTGIGDGPRIWLTGALALGSLMLPWTAVINNHGLAASFAAIGFFAILEARHRNDARGWIAAAGFFLSLAAISDLSTGAIYVAFGLLIAANPALKRHIFLYLLPCAVTAVPYFWINYQISGSIVPVQLNEEFFNYPGSPWIGSNTLSGINANSPRTILRNGWTYLFGANGFVLYNPLLFVAVPAFLNEIWRRRPFWREALAVFGATCAIYLFYISMTNNESGGSFSIRWFVPLLPLHLFFLYSFVDRITKLRATIFATLTALSVLIAAIGVVSPWSDKRINYVSLLANLNIPP